MDEGLEAYSSRKIAAFQIHTFDIRLYAVTCLARIYIIYYYTSPQAKYASFLQF